MLLVCCYYFSSHFEVCTFYSLFFYPLLFTFSYVLMILAPLLFMCRCKVFLGFGFRIVTSAPIWEVICLYFCCFVISFVCLNYLLDVALFVLCVVCSCLCLFVCVCIFLWTSHLFLFACLMFVLFCWVFFFWIVFSSSLQVYKYNHYVSKK